MLYTGVTSDLARRVLEHKHHVIKGFTSRYNVEHLVYFEMTGTVWEALRREKQIKSWRREKKVRLIESLNPEWEDLASGQPVGF